ncbi:MAG: hypothetical protein RL220_1746 [Bacteroidota bacterium]
MRSALLIFCIAISAPSVLAQFFTNQTSSLGINFTYNGDEYGGGVSFVDFDKDGWDDISFTQSGSAPVFYRNTGGNFVLYSLPITNSGNMKNLIWVDYDNDGDRDLFTCGLNMSLRLYQNNGSMGLIDVTASAGLPMSTLYMHYSGNWGDYDRDGDLDLYISNYNGIGFPNPTLTNILMRNNGDGTFTDVTVFAGVGNGSCYTFQSLWIDYNMDMWPDLMVMNDRSNCDNYLYHNNGNGTFTDVSIESGIGNHFIFSMNVNGDDYDNDGDLDTYVTNNPSGNILYRNNGSGEFDEVAEEAGVALGDHSWAGQFFDYDNDTYLDLHVSVSPFWGEPGQNRFFRNQGNGTFTEFQNSVGLGGDVGWHHSTAIGDYNNDGHFDIASVLDSPTLSRIWSGGLSWNNWLKVTPQGTIGNKDGVGAWIHCYAGGNHYVRYTYCGEGYLGQNSFSEIFGLIDFPVVDSLVVNWPSGITDHYYDVAVNQHLTLIEGSTVSIPLSADGSPNLCPGGAVTLTAGNFESYLWSNGEITPSITVDSPGLYSCTVTTSEGFIFDSETIEVSALPAPQVDAYIQDVSCFGQQDALIILNCETGIDSVSWNDGQYSDAVIGSIPVGQYFYELTDLNGCTISGECNVNQPSPLTEEHSVTHNLCFGGTMGTATIVPDGGTPPYQIFWSDGNGTSLAAGDYGYSVMDANGCSVEGNFSITQPDELIISISSTDASFAFGLGSAEATVSGGTPPYEIQWSSGDMGDTANQLFEGDYVCWVTDANGCESSSEVQILYNNVLESDPAGIAVYPVPAADYITFGQNLKSLDASIISVVDISGRTVMSVRADLISNDRLDIRQLAEGQYVIVIFTNDYSILRSKFVKQNN